MQPCRVSVIDFGFVTWQWQGVHLLGRRIATAPDFVVNERLEVRGYNGDDLVSLNLQFSDTTGRYFVDRFTLSVSGESNEITSARIRDVPVLSLTRAALREGAVVEFRDGGLFDIRAVEAAAADLTAGGPSSDEAMLATARTYRYAVILQQSPAKLVQEVLGLTAPTATLWIRRARALGLLGTYGGADG